ncbi:MAG: nucleotide exchange factor GrpE [Bacteroidetes bacterium]|nr:MAG: nucleotide exchange factor GrpE [Bacteroidota bacterium]
MIKHDKEKKDLKEEKESQKAAEKSQKNNNTDNSTLDKKTEEEVTQEKPEAEDEKTEASGDIEMDEKDRLIISLEAKKSELNDKFLRLFSEFDNYRKRTHKERQELLKTASSDIIEAILPIVDDLERAYKSAVENPDMETLTEGINLIRTKLNTTLRHKGLEEIPSIGEEFNTDYHEAITHVPAEDKKNKGKIVDEIQKGYLLNGKVLRFAKVVVAN